MKLASTPGTFLALLLRPGTCWLAEGPAGNRAFKLRYKPYVACPMSEHITLHTREDNTKFVNLLGDLTGLHTNTIYLNSSDILTNITKAQFKCLWNLSKKV